MNEAAMETAVSPGLKEGMIEIEVDLDGETTEMLNAMSRNDLISALCSQIVTVRCLELKIYELELASKVASPTIMGD